MDELEPNKEDQPVNTTTTATLEPLKPVDPVTENVTPVIPINPDESTNPPVTPPITSTVISPEKPKGKKKKWLIVTLISFFVLGGSALAFFTIYIPYAEGQIFDNTLANTFSTTSLKAELVLIPDQLPGGISDYKLSASVANTGDVEATLSIRVLGNPVALDAKYVDNVIYVRLTGINSLMSLAGAVADPALVESYGPVISSIDNQWISIDKSTLSLFGVDTSTILPTSSSQSPDQLVGLFKDNPFIQLDQRLDDTNVNGTNSYHYTLKVDTEVMSSFLDALVGSKFADFTAKDAKNIKTTFDASTAAALNLELWVDKDQELINRVKADSTTLGNGFSVTIDMTDYNTPFTIEAPANAIPVLNLLAQLGAGGADLSSLVPGFKLPVQP